jgi:hypothetical protein
MNLLEKIETYLSEGGSTTPKYVVDMKLKRGYTDAAEWRVNAQYGMRGYGKPTTANLKKYIDAYNDSLESGGVNAHIGPSGKAIWAGIRFNTYGTKYIAEWGMKTYSHFDASGKEINVTIPEELKESTLIEGMDDSHLDGIANTKQIVEVGYEKGTYYGQLRDMDTKLVDSSTTKSNMEDIFKWLKEHKIKSIKWSNGRSGTIDNYIKIYKE